MRRKPSEEVRKPLSLAVIHILLALTEGARHGYAIKQDVEERTNGSIRLGPGTLYEAIQRLQQTGLIGEESSHNEDPANGQQAQRRYYALTERGWHVLEHEVRALDAIVNQARAHPKLRKGLT
jgi:DNA-binding PadR family transcriptional regulator